MGQNTKTVSVSLEDSVGQSGILQRSPWDRIQQRGLFLIFLRRLWDSLIFFRDLHWKKR